MKWMFFRHNGRDTVYYWRRGESLQEGPWKYSCTFTGVDSERRHDGVYVSVEERCAYICSWCEEKSLPTGKTCLDTRIPTDVFAMGFNGVLYVDERMGEG